MADYSEPGPTREEVDAMRGFTVLDFGENWCGYCQAARPHIEAALANRTDVTHIKVLDGRGKPLGRSFRVKLWPTLIMLKDGVETARVVRPTSPDEVQAGLESLS
jgi:thioredoxin 1